MVERLRITTKRRSKLGRKGGLSTLRKLGRAHFRRASLARKRFAGGRPRGKKPIFTRT